MFAELDRRVTEGETANWLPGRRSLRPFDILSSNPPPPGRHDPNTLFQPGASAQYIGYDIGVTDPTRVGRLPPGTPYFQRDQCARRMQRKKNQYFRYCVNTFGPLTSEVKFIPLVFEVSGAFGPAAAEEFSVWCKEAAESVKKSGGLNYRARGEPHTWNALKFANMYSQMISFTIVKSNALSILRAVNKTARVQEGEAEMQSPARTDAVA